MTAIPATKPSDSIPTVLAIGLLAYASADIGHHALGHGAACLAEGGRIRSLSSIFVNCTVTGSMIDLAGPFANLLIGLLALLALRAIKEAAPTVRLFLTLTVAFNLMWFALPLAFSAATRTDDWAWAMQEYHVTGAARAGMIAAGVLGYVAVVRVVAALLAPFAQPIARLRTILTTAWLTAGVLACVTAAFEHHVLAAELHHAAPQSLLTAIGLLFVPKVAAAGGLSGAASRPIGLSVLWLAAAVIVGIASVLVLGPGISVAW